MATSLVNLPKKQLIIQSFSWSLNESHDALSNSSFNNIPNEIIIHIFSFLSVRSLCNVSLVCLSFKMIADRDEIWKYKSNSKLNSFFSIFINYAKNCWIASIKLPFRSYKQIYIEWMHKKSRRYIKPSKAFKHDSETACVMYRPPLGILRKYSIRSGSGNQFERIGGFRQHPNSQQNL